MTTDNQTTVAIEETTYPKATAVSKSAPVAKSAKPAGMKSLSLRPTRSVTKNNSMKPLKKLR